MKNTVLLLSAIMLFAACEKQHQVVYKQSSEDSLKRFSFFKGFNLNSRSLPLIVRRYNSAKQWMSFVDSFKRHRQIRKTYQKTMQQGYSIHPYEYGFPYQWESGISPSMYILDFLELKGYHFGNCDRAGASPTCVARLKSGFVDQADQTFLSDCDIEAGWILPCVSYALSDCEIYFNQENEFSEYREQVTGSSTCVGSSFNEIQFNNIVASARVTALDKGFVTRTISPYQKEVTRWWKCLEGPLFEIKSTETGLTEFDATMGKWRWLSLKHASCTVEGMPLCNVEVVEQHGTPSFHEGDANVYYAGMELDFSVKYSTIIPIGIPSRTIPYYSRYGFWDAKP